MLVRDTHFNSAANGLFTVMLIGLVVGATLAQQPTQQRPRRVAGADNASQQNSQPPNGEEVDEGDVLRVETQLVSVPAVVTNRNGRPIANNAGEFQGFRGR